MGFKFGVAGLVGTSFAFGVLSQNFEVPAAFAKEPPPSSSTPIDAVPTPTVLEKLNSCLSLQDASTRQLCLAQAAPLLEKGILYQACLWGVIPSDPQDTNRRHSRFVKVQCEETVEVNSVLDKERADFLGQALDAVNLLGSAPVEQVMESLRSLRLRAAELAESSRGGFSLVSQGGVSLGSWQGGYTYYLTEVLKQRRNHLVAKLRLEPGAPAIITSTGASAGAINALISGIEGCSTRQISNAEDSFYYDVWVNKLGFHRADGKPGLLSNESSSRLALFSAKPVEDALVGAAQYAAALDQVPQGCSFSLGLVVTHLTSVKAPVHVDTNGRALVTAQRLTERFSFRVSPKAGAEPGIINLTPPERPPLANTLRTPEHAYYAKLGPTDAVSPALLFQAVRASGAYPLAFAPVDLTYQSWDSTRGNHGGYAVQPTTTFVDGGTLDNAPIRLATKLNAWKQAPLKNPWLADLFKDPVTYVFVNPGVTSWPTHVEQKTEEEKSKAPSLWETYSKFGLDLLSTGLEAELSSTAEQLDFVREQHNYLPRMSIPRRNMPITGERLLHFMAFLNHDFRDFDFHVGMVDAAEQMQQQQLSDMREFEADVAKRQRGKKFACLRAYYQLALPSTPNTDAENAFAARALNPADLTQRDFKDTCGAIIQGENFRALLAAMHNFKHWTRTSNYKSAEDIDKFFDFLQISGFVFRGGDADFDDELNSRPKVAFRRLLQTLINRLAAKHEGLVSSLIDVGGTAAADALVLRYHPRWAASLGIASSGFETGLGYSPSQFSTLGLRFEGRLRFYDFKTRATIRNHLADDGSRVTERSVMWRNSGYAGMALTIPLTFVAPSGIVDFELGLGATYEQALAPGAKTSDVVLHALGATAQSRLVFLQHLYLNFEGSYYDWPFGHQWIDAKYQSDPPATQWNPYNIQVSAGWRFFIDDTQLYGSRRGQRVPNPRRPRANGFLVAP